MDNYSRGNDFPMIKNFRHEKIFKKFLVDNYSLGNDFPIIKNFRHENIFMKIFSG